MYYQYTVPTAKNIVFCYDKIIRIQLTSYLNLKPVNWIFIHNQLTNCYLNE